MAESTDYHGGKEAIWTDVTEKLLEIDIDSSVKKCEETLKRNKRSVNRTKPF